jgi:hypothetical protein
MRSLLLAALNSFSLLILAVGTASAAAPGHDLIRDSGSDPDFCGTGETVDFTVMGVFNGWDDKAFGHISTTWTNPDNGVSIVDSFSGGGKITWLDDGDGAYTILTVREGQPDQLRYANGRLISVETGLVAFYDHFDADDNYLGTDVVVLGGPHPSLDGGPSFCDKAIEALGL